MPKVFISHTHSDKEIADALFDAMRSLFGDGVDVEYSTKKEEGRGILPGTDWFGWIVNQVVEADVALVLLTPGSIQKPWILWEAGAVQGAALASQLGEDKDKQRHRKVRPLVFHLKSSDIPSPFHRIQTINGDQKQDIELFFTDLIRQFEASVDQLQAGKRLEKTIEDYLERVSAAMLKAPLMVTEAAVQEWLRRLDPFEARPSEIDQLHDWMNLAFGRNDEDKDRPLDLRIHRRLGELYAKTSTVESRRRAARELELARQLSPRDIFILRLLGNAYIAIEKYGEAWKIIEEIEQLDPKAFGRNAECAALRGKWLRRNNDPQAAFALFVTALRHNPDSYYLANLAAEASIEAADKDRAREYYSKSLAIIERLDEPNIWTYASAANACLAEGRDDRAEAYVRSIAAARPSNEELNAIEGGLAMVQQKFDRPPELLASLNLILRGGISP